MENNAPIDISTLPGFALFTPAYQRLLTNAAAGDPEHRSELLARTQEAVAVFAELELLQFVYLPSDDEPEVDTADDEDVAWFSVDGVEVDDDRDAVMLIGDVTHLYGGPITLEGVDDEEDVQ